MFANVAPTKDALRHFIFQKQIPESDNNNKTNTNTSNNTTVTTTNNKNNTSAQYIRENCSQEQHRQSQIITWSLETSAFTSHSLQVCQENDILICFSSSRCGLARLTIWNLMWGQQTSADQNSRSGICHFRHEDAKRSLGAPARGVLVLDQTHCDVFGRSNGFPERDLWLLNTIDWGNVE